MSFIEIDKASFIYPDGTKAVDDISINIEKGENVAIMGQNGAGKTTTVKMLNGLLKPSKGEVIVGGWNTKNYTTAQMSRKVGYVFQNPMDQIFHSNVYDEIAFGPKKLKYSDNEIKKIVEKAIEMTGLSNYTKENPYNLPYSVRKFVTVAAIIAMETEVIIMDEPTAGQDMKGIKILDELTRELINQGKTIITITHDMEFVVSNFERIIVMANKKVIGDGNKKDIFKESEMLSVGKIKAPYISNLANELSMDKSILTIDDFAEKFSEKIK